MNPTLILAAVTVVLFVAMDRVLLRMESRGWIRYRRSGLASTVPGRFAAHTGLASIAPVFDIGQMAPLASTVTDEELIAFVDEWAALLEQEDYDAAFAHTDHVPQMGWTPELLRDAIQGYGGANAGQRVTVDGVPTEVAQRKEVDRWPANDHGVFGEIWYDLNIDGRASDLTATFALQHTDGGVAVLLDDIHVT
ncbi:MAG TPA: hypothetical protein VFR37_13760 [Longimicrobium sp.]|nr:hypothetical protein [Longimicrobium sp.]